MDKINLNFLNKLAYQKEVEKKEEEKAPVEDKKAEETPKKDQSEFVLESMNLIAMRNKAQIKMGLIDPKEYLSENRIKDIEKSMSGFEDGTENYAGAIAKEFPGLNDVQKYAVAAKAFASNQ